MVKTPTKAAAPGPSRLLTVQQQEVADQGGNVNTPFKLPPQLRHTTLFIFKDQ
jgi:hypothetical protein